MRALGLALILLAGPALAESVVATRVLKPDQVITAEDVTLVAADIPGAATSLPAVLGLSPRTAIYAGRPVLTENLGPAALVARNQIVVLIFRQGPLAIVAEGRALAKGAAGEVIKVMNTASRATLLGQVQADGSILVSPER